MSWKSENEDDPNREKTPFLSPIQAEEPKEIPKYLELVYEPEQESALENDGYEVPNDMIDAEELANISASQKSPEKSEEIVSVASN